MPVFAKIDLRCARVFSVMSRVGRGSRRLRPFVRHIASCASLRVRSNSLRTVSTGGAWDRFVSALMNTATVELNVGSSAPRRALAGRTMIENCPGPNARRTRSASTTPGCITRRASMARSTASRKRFASGRLRENQAVADSEIRSSVSSSSRAKRVRVDHATAQRQDPTWRA
jgi:hypothetical protein